MQECFPQIVKLSDNCIGGIQVCFIMIVSRLHKYVQWAFTSRLISKQMKAAVTVKLSDSQEY